MSNRTNTTITPSIARELLKRNLCDRPLSPSIVNEYAARIRFGEWQQSPESQMVRDECGNLIDGQHRAHAIVQTGIALVDVPLATNVPLVTIEKSKPKVVIQCPHCQNVDDENIYVVWNEVTYARVFPGEIEGNLLPLQCSYSEPAAEKKLTCDNCDGTWDIPENAELQW